MAQRVSKSRSPWIYSPVLDLILGCGAWSLPLLLAGWALAANQAWVVLFYGLALFFNYPHYMATIHRAYHTKEDFARYRILTVHVTILLSATLVVAHGSRGLMAWLSTIYVSCSPWHYMGQNFGLAMMFIRRSGLRIDQKDRNALWAAFIASYLIIFLSFHTNPSTDPNFISLGFPTLLDTLRVPLVAVFLVLGIYPISKLVRKAGFRPMLPVMILLSTEFLWFVLPTIVELTNSVHVPPRSYSAGILALMHSAQYLWITSYYARQESQSDKRKWTWNSYLLPLVVGGIALFIPGPWLAARFFHVDFTLSVLAFAAVVNIHHFILDGAIWKLRESRIASVLLRDTTQAAPATLWLRLTERKWRPVLVTAASLMIALAGLDQLYHYLGTKNDVKNLTIAAELIPVDSVVQSRLARILIQEQRYDEAYEHYRTLVEQRAQPSIPTLLNFGMLCKLRGDAVKAVETFERVLALNPNSAPAHLQIGETLQSMGRLEEAAEHFERYRALLAADPGRVSGLRPQTSVN